jgi:SAM-dependent methyltransferase
MHSLASLDPVLLRALELAPGQRVLDFGCGMGEPTLSIARWVAPRGTVLGLDVSATMLDVARRRARSLLIRNARFRRGDITRFDPGRQRFDRVVARFGLMFTDDVPGALSNIHRLLRPGGRVAFAVWAGERENPSFALSARIVRPLLTPPLPDPEESPHPLRFARPGLLPRLMRKAGFRRVSVTDAPVSFVYSSAEDYARATVDISSALRGPLARLSPRQVREVAARLERGARRFRDGSVVRLPGLARVVAAAR